MAVRLLLGALEWAAAAMFAAGLVGTITTGLSYLVMAAIGLVCGLFTRHVAQSTRDVVVRRFWAAGHAASRASGTSETGL